jgi:hypothetical protein
MSYGFQLDIWGGYKRIFGFGFQASTKAIASKKVNA